MNKCTTSLATFCAVTAVLFVGAQPTLADGKDDLLGKWSVDFDESAKLIDDEKVADEIKQAGSAGLKITMEFKADGKAEMSIAGLGESDEKKGTWKVLKAGDKSLTIELVDAEDEDDKDELDVKFISKDRVSISKEGDPVKLVFNRVKE